ncbi:hypothetical protein [Salidesulfovibrio brasiliensis]|uniref:hypothetical protein n=1 Tax=Salidesulfovibrio brasiliensis TaxID=221711 RepID=UPI000AEA784F|nr:hypothetical protein [Salidesulfovibrio brasiliensis]
MENSPGHLQTISLPLKCRSIRTLRPPKPGGLLDQFETYATPQVDKWIERKKGL